MAKKVQNELVEVVANLEAQLALANEKLKKNEHYIRSLKGQLKKAKANASLPLSTLIEH